MEPIKTLARKTVLQHSQFFTLEMHTVAFPGGRVIEEWPWIITPDYINVVAETEEGRFLFFEQVKYAVDGVSLAPVGGYIDPGELPFEAAQRELLEETGHEAPDWVTLGSYVVDGNRGAGTGHMFLARHARRVTAPSADDLEEQRPVTLTREEMQAALSAGAFKVMGWALNVALTLNHLASK